MLHMELRTVPGSGRKGGLHVVCPPPSMKVTLFAGVIKDLGMRSPWLWVGLIP